MKLELDGLGKRYGDTWALRGVDLELESGVVGLLGPNGAGKSTLMQIVTTFTKPTEGTVRWNGTDTIDSPGAIRGDIGYLPQQFGVYPSLSAREFLQYLAAVRGLSSPDDRIEQLLELVNLGDAADDRLGGFSGGMRRRVGIAQALLTDPALLIVDEPTVGLDPTERARFRSLLSGLAADRIVVLSTHIVPDVEATADEVALLDDGELLAHTTPADLLADVEGSVWEIVVPESELSELKSRYTVASTTRRSDGVHLRVIAPERPLQGASPVEPTLEEAYLSRIEASPTNPTAEVGQ